MTDLKLMVQTALYKSFKEHAPYLVTMIEQARDCGYPQRTCIKQVETAAKKFGSKDNGNNLILLVEYIYSQPKLD